MQATQAALAALAALATQEAARLRGGRMDGALGLRTMGRAMPPGLSGPSLFGRLTLTACLLWGCAGCAPAPPYGPYGGDGFRQRLTRGCGDLATCDPLVQVAEARRARCAADDGDARQCRDAEADLALALTMRDRALDAARHAEAQRRDQARADAAAREEREARAERQAEHQRERDREDEARAAQERAAWLVLDLRGCAERGAAEACAQIERFITTHPQSPDVEEAARSLQAGRERIARAARNTGAPSPAAPEPTGSPRQPLPGSPQRPAPPPSGTVCCCDGTVSPTCTTVKRGCCSHHGGVCACE
ncbi:hypothetical protein [Chondromyces apiculatus]|uniref:Uncharacterized protein n=1 Tax=Chondromyces apiculatus DSM 436 TaxID=1192034 RepID=A0A017T8Q7_9BACT|nr:hypothetical protein [Chondromyces apiculatus]EYF05195.1 Hypothetical protein CAP_3560 [Chondromyces apiculatus DSM 436]